MLYQQEFQSDLIGQSRMTNEPIMNKNSATQVFLYGGQTTEGEPLMSIRLAEDKLLNVPDEISAQPPPYLDFVVNKKEKQIKKLKSINITKTPLKSNFFLCLTDNSKYKDLLNAIEDIEKNELKKAKEKLCDLVDKLKDKVWLISNQSDDKQNQVICFQAYYYLSKVFQSEGLTDQAIDVHKLLLEKFEIFDLHIKGQILISLGTLYRISLNFQEATTQFYNALIIYERLNWKVQQADCLLQLGVMYSILNEHESAKAVTYEALDIYKDNAISESIKVGKAYMALGKIFYYSKAFEVAIEYLEKSLKIYLDFYKNDFDYNFIPLYNLLGITNQLLQNTEVAIDFYTMAIRCYKGSFDAQVGQILNNIGVGYLELKKWKLANDFFQNADQIYSMYFKENHQLRQRVKLNIDCIKTKFDQLN